jgi:hypothetical protein
VASIEGHVPHGVGCRILSSDGSLLSGAPCVLFLSCCVGCMRRNRSHQKTPCTSVWVRASRTDSICASLISRASARRSLHHIPPLGLVARRHRAVFPQPVLMSDRMSSIVVPMIPVTIGNCQGGAKRSCRGLAKWKDRRSSRQELNLPARKHVPLRATPSQMWCRIRRRFVSAPKGVPAPSREVQLPAFPLARATLQSLWGSFPSVLYSAKVPARCNADKDVLSCLIGGIRERCQVLL